MLKLFGLVNLFLANLATITYSYSDLALQDQVLKLPGLDYSSIPSFNQFSGYLDFDTKHIHYWFVESIKSPETAPLVFWTNGGPGCSGLLGFLTEQGPFRPMEDGSLVFNEWTWNQNANMVFIEQPVGVGFSYADNSQDYKIGDDQAAQDNVQVILKFLEKFPEFSKTPIYLTAESYGGHYIPTWADAILEYNYAKPSTPINLAGFAVGNPYVDYWSGVGAQMEAYWDHQLIDEKSWSMYESNGCVNAVGFLNNSICSTLSLDFMKKIGSINPYALDYPVCLTPSQIHMLEFIWGLEQNSNINTNNKFKFLRGSTQSTLPYEPCEDSWTENYLNIPQVKTELHVKDIYWVECSRTTKYDLRDKMKSTIHIYRKLIEQSKTKLNIMIYSGDDDSVCATKYTNEWVYGLGYPVSSNWKVWEDLDGQVAGYETIFKPASGNKFKFATVHGAGHEVPTYKPAQAFVLFNNWLGLN